MSRVIPIFGSDPTNYRRAIHRIRHLWERGAIRPTAHALAQMEVRGLDMLDIEHIIRWGKVTEHSLSSDNWRYRIDGTTVEEERAACVVEIHGLLVLITAFYVL